MDSPGDTLGITPSRTICVDTLHANYLGPVLVVCMRVMWVMIRAGIWAPGIAQSEEAANNVYVALLLKQDLFAFYKEWKTTNPGQKLTEVSDITPKMIGAAGANPMDHKGCLMKVKAAETSILMGFALHALRTHNLNQPQLIAAGEALSNYLLVMHSADAVPSNTDCRLLMDHMITHLVLCEGAHVHYAPKHHLCVEMTFREYFDGSL